MNNTKKNIIIPEGMLQAVLNTGPVCYGDIRAARQAELEAALRWLSEHPIVPDVKTLADMRREAAGFCTNDGIIMHVIEEWQRRMFSAPTSAPPLTNQ